MCIIFKFIPYIVLEPETACITMRKMYMGSKKNNTNKRRNTNKRSGSSKKADASLKTEAIMETDVNMKSNMSEKPAASKKDNTSDKTDVGKTVETTKNVSTFVSDVIKEFRSGIVKLIGWSIPLFILGLLWNAIASTTYNNDLRVDEINFSITDNMALSTDNNQSLYHEYDEQKNTYSYSYDAMIKGHGKIESAWVAYAYNGDIIPVRIDINNSIFRIVHVSPSKIHFQVTYIANKDETDGIKRAYLILKDGKTKTHQVYLLEISNKDGEIEWSRESEFLSISPMDQDVNGKEDDNLSIAFHREEINEEMKTIRLYFGE